LASAAGTAWSRAPRRAGPEKAKPPGFEARGLLRRRYTSPSPGYFRLPSLAGRGGFSGGEGGFPLRGQLAPTVLETAPPPGGPFPWGSGLASLPDET